MSEYDLDFDEFVLAAPTDTLAVEPDAREHADAVEFRLDLADNPLDQLAAYDGELPLIATNRAAWEAGGADDETERLVTLETALEYDAVAAVDLESRALTGAVDAAATDRAREVRATARERGVPVIASVHDFDGTPPVDELADLLRVAGEAGDVAKLATTAQDREDALALLTATHRATAAGETVATMGMGAAGQHTRAVAPVYGSKIGYAPVDPADATAPGQYPLAELRRLVAELQSPA
ncbi:type I 3-dehydroquinate dehydratase [Halonotius terrestris]|uniref:3-dehydroquinate dehydratase n=1 Tax=Halonotius terrestris TaxID=2487750 RepID=A0A8J8PCJ5_9EURY|nr:type I 3-dehydroquinate dehydratase [Halonotius terrestris]TQQ81059.1 type I 3-dehydroquinate dehydratase [Halonotius terrestris]